MANGKKNIAAKKSSGFDPPIGTYVIVRATGAGCHAGEFAGHNGSEVLLKNARRLWRFQAQTLSELAVYGARSGDNRFAPVVAHQQILDACEIIVCQPAGEKMIREFSEWRA